MQNITEFNKDKYHFFIGNIFNNENQLRLLKNIQKKLIKKYKLKNYHWNSKYCSNLIYLGYLDQNTAAKYMDNIIVNLLKAVSEKFNNLECEYTGYKIEYDKSFYKISLKINDINNYLENIIVPYLHQNAILPIYEKKKNILKPSIDLVYYKDSSKISGKKNDIKIMVPTEKFTIDHISLIRGNSVRVRSGTPSLHNQMNLEEIYKYSFPLKGSLNN
jgi:hypothetical protein